MASPEQLRALDEPGRVEAQIADISRCVGDAVLSHPRALAVWGYVVSPWWFVIAWGVHALWDLLPREGHDMHGATMGHLGMSPVAALLYELPILAYLVFAARSKLLGTLPRTVND